MSNTTSIYGSDEEVVGELSLLSLDASDEVTTRKTDQPTDTDLVEKALKEALESRQPLEKLYEKVILVSICFAGDDTGAMLDCDTVIQSVRRNFPKSETKKIVIGNERSYSRRLQMTFDQFLDEQFTVPWEKTGHIVSALLIVHYAGHGTHTRIRDKSTLSLSSGEQKIDFNMIKRLCKAEDAGYDDMDVLFVIDSCYSANAARRENSTRKFEILAATTEETLARSTFNRRGVTFHKDLLQN